MTSLLNSKPVTRETLTAYKGRALVATLNKKYLSLREKGRRDTLDVSYDAIYELALKLRWRKLQAEKKGQRHDNRRAKKGSP